MDSVSDRELVKHFQRGDERAFAQLVQRHQDRIFRLARARLYVPQHAGDAAQDVFLRAYSGLRGFLFAAEPFTWIYRTMINVCNEYNRKTERDQRMFSAWEETTDAEAPASEDIGAIDARTIRRLVAALPARQREVVMLRVFEDMSVEEVARAMGCRPGTVKAALHKALANLRQAATGDNIAEERT